MGSIDIPPFMREKMKQNKKSSDSDIPPFLKKKEVGESISTDVAVGVDGQLTQSVPTTLQSGLAENDFGQIDVFNNPLNLPKKATVNVAGVPVKLSSNLAAPIPLNSATYNQDVLAEELQSRIDTKTYTPSDVDIVAQSMKVSPLAATAYMDGKTGTGSVIHFNDIKAEKNNQLKAAVEKANIELGRSDNFEEVFATPELAGAYIQKIQTIYENKAKIESVSAVERTAIENPILFGEGLANVNDTQSKKTLNAAQEIKNIITNDIIDKVSADLTLNKDQKVKKIYELSNSKGKKNVERAIAERLNPLRYLMDNALGGSTEKDIELLNADKAAIELGVNRGLGEQLKYSDALKESISEEYIAKVNSGEISAEDETARDYYAKRITDVEDEKIQIGKDYVPDKAIYEKYPILQKTAIANSINEYNAIKSGNVEGYENLIDFRREENYPTLEEHLRNNGFDIKSQVVQDVLKGNNLKDYSFFGRPLQNALDVFTNTAKGIGDITGVRDEADILSEKKQSELFPTQVGAKDEFQLTQAASVGQNIGNTTGQVIGQGLLQAGTAGVGRILGLTKVAAANAAFFSSGTLVSYDSHLKDSYDLPIETDAGRVAYAGINSFFEGAVEKIFPEAKLFQIPGFKDAAVQLAGKLSKGELTDKLTTELLTKAKNSVVNYGVKYGENISKESLEEGLTSAFNSATRLIVGDPNTNIAQAIEDVKNTVIQTAIGTSLIGGFGANRDIQNERNVSAKSTIYNAAIYHDEALDAINLGFTNNQYSEAEKNAKISVLNTARQAVSVMEKTEQIEGKNLTRPERELYVANLTAEVALKEQKKEVDELEQGNIDIKISNLQNQRKQILSGEVIIDDNGNISEPQKVSAPIVEETVTVDEPIVAENINDLTPEEQIVIEGFKGVEFTGSTKNWTDVIQSETSTPQEKKQALTELKEQLSDHNSEIATGEALGKSADLIYGLIDADKKESPINESGIVVTPPQIIPEPIELGESGVVVTPPKPFPEPITIGENKVEEQVPPSTVDSGVVEDRIDVKEIQEIRDLSNKINKFSSKKGFDVNVAGAMENEVAEKIKPIIKKIDDFKKEAKKNGVSIYNNEAISNKLDSDIQIAENELNAEKEKLQGYKSNSNRVGSNANPEGAYRISDINRKRQEAKIKLAQENVTRLKNIKSVVDKNINSKDIVEDIIGKYRTPMGISSYAPTNEKAAVNYIEEGSGARFTEWHDAHKFSIDFLNINKQSENKPIQNEQATNQQANTENQQSNVQAEAAQPTETIVTETTQPTEEGGSTPPPINENTTESPTEESGVGITLSQTAEIRGEFGLPEYAKEPQTFEQWDKEAKKRIENGEMPALLKKLKDKIPPTEVEQRMMGQYIANLEEIASRTKEDKDITKLHEAIKLSDAIGGSSIGRALVARRGIFLPDDSLAGFFVAEMEASQVSILTDEQKAVAEKEYNDLKAANEKYRQDIEALSNANSKLKAEAKIKTVTPKIKSKDRKTKEDFKKERDSIVESMRKKLAQARGELNIVPLPYAKELISISPDIARMVKSYVDEGITKLAEIVDNIHEILKDNINSITKNDVQDLIAGVYNPPAKTKTELQIQLQDVKDEAKLINKLQKLQNGEVPKTPKEKKERNQNIQALQNEIKEFNKRQKEADKFYPEDVLPDAKKLISLKNKNDKEASEIQKQIDAGNFKPPEKNKPFLEDKEVQRNFPELYKKAKSSKDKLIKVKQDREIRLLKEEYANRTKWQKRRDLALEILNVPRTIMSSIDFSAPLRQGVVPSISHPKLAAKAFVEMFRQAVSQKRFDRWFFDLRQDPEFTIMEKSGLYVADPHDLKLSAKEEQFMNNLAEKIPLIGKLIKGSERAYVSYLNKMRVDLFKQGEAVLISTGKTLENSPEAYKGLASWVNNSTGRGGLGKAETMAPILNSVFFSPRLIASRLNLLNPIYYAKLPPNVRKMALGDMAKFATFGLSVLSLAALGADDDDDEGISVETDIRSTDFGKIKLGDTRYDIWGGFQQYVRVIGQFFSGQSKSQAGNIREIDGSGRFGEDRTDLISRFFRGKLAPVPATITDLVSGRTIMGDKIVYQFGGEKLFEYGEIPDNKEITVTDEVMKILMPLVLSDVSEAIKNEGASALFTTWLPATFGVGVQTYESKR